MTKHSATLRGGFTIIELLVAASLTLLIAATIVTLMANAITGWSRAHGTLAVEGQARVALDQIERDLEGALIREDGHVWLAATVQATGSVSPDWVDGTKPIASSLDPIPANWLAARFGVAGIWLRLFTTVPGDAGIDNSLPAPTAVSYQIVRRAATPSRQSHRYLLYRAEMTSAATHAAGFNFGSANYDPAGGDSALGRVLTRPESLQVLANNVIDFGIRFHGYLFNAVTGESQLRTIFPTDPSDLEFRCQSSAGPRPFRRPVAADVFLRILTPEGARKIAALETGGMTGDWWEIAMTNSHVFSRRIRMRATGL